VQRATASATDFAPNDTMTPLQRLLRYFPPYKTRLALGMLCVLGGNLFKASGPVLLQQAIDSLSSEITNSGLLRYAVLLILVSLIQGAFLFSKRRLFISMALAIEYDLRNDFYRHLQKLPLEFFKANRTGDLMARATNDIGTIRTVVGWVTMDSMNTLISIAIIVPLVARIRWEFALLSFLPMLAMAVSAKFFGKRIRERSEEVQQALGEVSSRAHESLSGVRAIRAYNHEQAEVDAFRRINHQYVARNLRLIRLSAILYPFLRFFIALGFMAVLWHGGNLAIRGKITIGQFVQLTVYLEYLIWSVFQLGPAIDFFQRGMASMRRVHSVMSVEPTIADAPDAIDLSEIVGQIEFRDLTFKYSGAAQPALRGINLLIRPGQTVALVGAVGSGKSTLLNLVPRLLDAKPGQVLIDGRPIRQVPIKLLRSSIGYVTQECFLFSESIAGNIAFGMQESSQQEIQVAAAGAGIAEEIAEFPAGYETVIGEQGVTLSGGQKQRTTIARAIIRRPQILLLDDAFSSVDTYTEEKILKRLRSLMRGRTCLITSHRISTVKDADLIVVLDRGRVVEQGTHDKLVACGGLYAELYGKQLLREELSAS
jgi:ATP-binding cassette subfamily B multidrug efflux pump